MNNRVILDLFKANDESTALPTRRPSAETIHYTGLGFLLANRNVLSGQLLFPYGVNNGELFESDQFTGRRIYLGILLLRYLFIDSFPRRYM